MYNYKTLRQGLFKPENPKKYAGDPNNIVYRSNLEHRFFKVLDKNPDIIMWGSEEFSIPYQCPFDKRKIRRYFVDLIVRTKEYPGKPSRTFVIEIKPYKYTQEPKPTKGQSKKTIITEAVNWAINSAKWKAANKFCTDKGWEFKIFSEKDLNNVK